MHIKDYYCPRCKAFKSGWQVTNYDAYDFGKCKHCGTECVSVEAALAKLIGEVWEREQGKGGPNGHFVKRTEPESNP